MAPPEVLLCASEQPSVYLDKTLVYFTGRWELLIWLLHSVGDHCDSSKDLAVMAITFSCAARHFPAMYNLQGYQKPVPLITFLYVVGG